MCQGGWQLSDCDLSDCGSSGAGGAVCCTVQKVYVHVRTTARACLRGVGLDVGVLLEPGTGVWEHAWSRGLDPGER